MGGLAKLCKMYGSIEVIGKDGVNVTWIWDYVKDEPRLKKSITKGEIAASEKAKWTQAK